MSEDEALQLLLDAGVPKDRINADAILIASALGDVLAKRAADLLVERLLKRTTFGPRERPEGAVDFQHVHCKCGFIALRFGMLPLTECSECHVPIEVEWPEIING